VATEDLSSEILYPHWQTEYEAVVVEPDCDKLPDRISAAEIAIYNRLLQLSQDSNHVERLVIEDVLASLAVLKKNEPMLRSSVSSDRDVGTPCSNPIP
jgi:hypothetical protein